MTREYTTAYKAGRCWNGFHLDSGMIVHLLEGVISVPCFSKAICGTETGLRSYGWAKTTKEVTCPKCIKRKLKLDNLNHANHEQ